MKRSDKNECQTSVKTWPAPGSLTKYFLTPPHLQLCLRHRPFWKSPHSSAPSAASCASSLAAPHLVHLNHHNVAAGYTKLLSHCGLTAPGAGALVGVLAPELGAHPVRLLRDLGRRVGVVLAGPRGAALLTLPSRGSALLLFVNNQDRNIHVIMLVLTDLGSP